VRPSRAAVALFLFAVAGGAILFPRALEPDPGEGTTTLYPIVPRSGSTDWFAASAAVQVTQAPDSLRVTGQTLGYKLLSRPIAVHPHRNYIVSARVDARTRDARLDIADAALRRFIAEAPMPSGRSVVRFRFSSGSHRRISVVLTSPPQTLVFLGAVKVAPA
jgi:hypothetical protein